MGLQESSNKSTAKLGLQFWTLQAVHMSMGRAKFCTLKESFCTDNLRLFRKHVRVYDPSPNSRANLGHWIGSGIASSNPIKVGVLHMDDFHMHPLLVGF